MRRKAKCPHTHFTRGKLVRVVLRDDSVIVGRFKERTARAVVVESEQQVRKIPTDQLRAMSFMDRSRA
jgi:hypothetical protein